MAMVAFLAGVSLAMVAFLAIGVSLGLCLATGVSLGLWLATGVSLAFGISWGETGTWVGGVLGHGEGGWVASSGCPAGLVGLGCPVLAACKLHR